MLQAAAQRGVKINVIVYKEVSQALTRKYLTPTLPDYLQSLLPRSIDPFTALLTHLGVHATLASLEAVERESPLIEPALPVSSVHTKHALEALHPNIAVFRHPDHLPDAQTFQSSLTSSLQNLNVTGETLAKLPGDALKALYGVSEDVILYWAHHEKLCLIDGDTAFLGGLDLAYGRWDPIQHPIADAHPEDLDLILYPGQDYNNARIMDFEDVAHWDQNKLDRKESSRMGWSDISISLHGPVVQDLRFHFVQRWNFIYNEKYDVRKDVRYSRLSLDGIPQPVSQGTQQSGPPQQQYTQGGYFPPPPQSDGQQQYSSLPQQASHSSQQHSYAPASNTDQLHGHYPPPPSGPPTGGSAQHTQQGQHFPPPPPGPPPSGDQGLYQYNPATHGPAQAQPQYQAHSPGVVGEGAAGGSSHQPQYHAYHPGGRSDDPPPYAEGSSAQYQPDPEKSSGSSPYFPPPPTSDRGRDRSAERGLGSGRSSSKRRSGYMEDVQRQGEKLAGRLEDRMHLSEYFRPSVPFSGASGTGPRTGSMSCQIVRSATKWSNGTPTEHSIQNAYATVIRQSQHFVYIENQFFITATGSQQKPVQNLVGAAIVERILRAARAGEKYKIFVVIPAIPGFAGDLKDDSSLGTRAIMEYQYNSINRGGHSIMEEVSKAGFDPTEYIRFFNLRNYDRINAGSSMQKAEQASGIDYEVARQEHDAMVDPTGFKAQQGTSPGPGGFGHQNYDKYQDAQSGSTGNGRWDTVSACYMLNGPDIRTVPWQDGDLTEMEAFVTEELYIHSKVLIADDRIVICGSANMNDRSQLGTHDSEIACIIEDGATLDSAMNRRPWRAAKFAATLRRYLFRKHLGLLKPQDWTRPDGNFFPAGVPNDYDYDSPEDHLVADPMADQFLNFWMQRARTNTYAFGRIFHPVPHDDVRSWEDYDNFYEQYFKKADKEAEGKGGKAKNRWGHVVAEKFSPGDKGVKEVKDMLSTIKGTLVEMPLLFLIKEDIAKEGLSLNAFTEEVYT